MDLIFHGIRVHGIHQDETRRFSFEIDEGRKSLYKGLGIRLYAQEADSLKNWGSGR